MKVKEYESINRNSDGFPAFFRWLVDENDFIINLIIQVVEKPWKWQEEYEEWLHPLTIKSRRKK